MSLTNSIDPRQVATGAATACSRVTTVMPSRASAIAEVAQLLRVPTPTDGAKEVKQVFAARHSCGAESFMSGVGSVAGEGIATPMLATV